MTSVLRPIAMLTLIGTLAGCGTVGSLVDREAPTKVYAGTRASANSHGGMLDTPFSLVLDTALLPVTIPWTVVNRLAGREAARHRGQQAANGEPGK